jgi:uncharacterized protein
MKDLVTYIVKSVTLEPEKIIVDSETAEDGTNIITITAPQSQVGRIIGKMGKTINALRTIIKSSFPNERFRLEINEVPSEESTDNLAQEAPVSEDQISTQEDQLPTPDQEVPEELENSPELPPTEEEIQD